MKHMKIGVLAALMILAVTATMAFAATYPAKPAATKPAATPAVLDLQAKILTVGKGWVRVQVSKVVTGKGLRQGARIRVLERSKVKIMEKGQAATLSALKPGENVEILVQVSHSGKTVSYSTNSITIMQ